MGEEKPVARKRKKCGRPRAGVASAQPGLQRLIDVTQKVRNADVRTLNAIRRWLAGQMSVTTWGLDNIVYAKAVTEFLKDKPHLAGEMVNFQRRNRG